MHTPEEQTTKAGADQHDTMMPLLTAMYREFQDLAKKKPDSVVSKQKIKIVNRLLEDLRTLLKGEKSLQYLDLLEEDDVPQVSDVTLILSQYVAAMEAFKQRFYGWDGSEHRWFTKG